MSLSFNIRQLRDGRRFLGFGLNLFYIVVFIIMEVLRHLHLRIRN